jgi:WD40 repeat protein
MDGTLKERDPSGQGQSPTGKLGKVRKRAQTRLGMTKGKGKSRRSKGGGSEGDPDSEIVPHNTEERDEFIVKTLTGHLEPVLCVKIFNNCVLSGSCDGTVKMYVLYPSTISSSMLNLCRWDMYTTECLHTFTGHSAWVCWKPLVLVNY